MQISENSRRPLEVLKEYFSKAGDRIKESKLWSLQRVDQASFLLGLGLVLFVVLLGLVADFIAPYSPTTIYPENVLEPPGFRNIFGTDTLGRDVWSRILFGARVSLLVGLISVLIASSVGVLLGVLAGYYGGWLDRLLTLPMDGLYAFPAFLTALLVSVALGGGPLYTSIAVAIGLVPRFYRTIRSAAVSISEEEFIEAEVSLGASDLYIVFRHVLPLTFSVLVVVFTISVATAILSISGLGFLGLGVPPPTPEWGSDLAAARPSILSGVWWTTMVPSAFIFITVLGFSLLGDSLNKILGTSLEEI